MKLPKPKKAPKVQTKYSFEEQVLFERIQKIRDDFEYKKRKLLRKS